MSYLDSLFGLDGRTAVVTGATSGLGAASAVGAGPGRGRVIVSGRDRERGEQVVAEIAPPGAARSWSWPTSRTRGRPSASPST